MSTYMSNLFNFSRALPSPFDKLGSKKIKVSSKYGDGTEATLTATMIKAVHAVCGCMSGNVEGAVGVIDHRYVAEYKSSMGPDEYHLVVYDSSSGNLMASIYDKNTEVGANYTLNSAGRDGAAVMMCIIPYLMQDMEFKENFEAYYDAFLAGYPDMTKATEHMAILCDNAYRRIKDDSCAAHVKVCVDKSGNLMRVSQAQLDAGKFTPTTVVAGEFTIFAKTGPATIQKATTLVEHKDFVGKYGISTSTAGVVYHSKGSGRYLQPCPGNHWKIHADEKFFVKRPCRYRKNDGCESDCSRTGTSVHEIYLFCKYRDL